MERLLKIREVSELLQISPKTIYNWVHYGYIPYFKVYGQRGTTKAAIRFRQSEIEQWLKRRRRAGRDSIQPEEIFLRKSGQSSVDNEGE